MKLIIPLIIALLGLGAGVGAGLALKPAPKHDDTTEHGPACEGSETPCATAEVDPFRPVHAEEAKPEGELTYVAMDKPFVVPVFKGEKVTAMVVVSLSVEVGADEAPEVGTAEPRLRDSFLKAMFRHANSGGFDGSFTTGRKIEDLKSALRKAAQEVMGAAPVGEVLITEIARQDM